MMDIHAIEPQPRLGETARRQIAGISRIVRRSMAIKRKLDGTFTKRRDFHEHSSQSWNLLISVPSVSSVVKVF